MSSLNSYSCFCFGRSQDASSGHVANVFATAAPTKTLGGGNFKLQITIFNIHPVEPKPRITKKLVILNVSDKLMGLVFLCVLRKFSYLLSKSVKQVQERSHLLCFFVSRLAQLSDLPTPFRCVTIGDNELHWARSP